jgi:hypothetical protein
VFFIRLVGRFFNNIFGRPSNRTTNRPSFGILDFKIQPIITQSPETVSSSKRPTNRPFFGMLDFKIQPLITQSPKTVSSAQLANQLAADGATGLDANQVDEDGIRLVAADIDVDPDDEDGIRIVSDVADIDNVDLDDEDVEDGFRYLGSVGECRQDYHCRGSEKCVRHNLHFM